MIITCEKCATRFNLDESLLHADGSTVRCSLCLHTFAAFPPPPEAEFDEIEFDETDFDETDFDEDLSEPPDEEKLTEDVFQETVAPETLELETSDLDEIDIDVEGEAIEEGEPDPSEKMGEPPEDPEHEEMTIEDNEPEFDLAFDLDEGDSLDEPTSGDANTAGDADETDAGESDDDRFDGLDDFDDPDDTVSSDTPSHEAPSPRRPARTSLIQHPDQEDAWVDAEEAPAKKRTGLGRPVLILLLLFVFAGGGYLAASFLGYKIPFLPKIQIPFIDQYLPEKTPAPASYLDPIPDQKSVTGRFVTNETAGELFIIAGNVQNPAQIPYRRIQVTGTLFQKEKEAAMSQVAFCGNIIPEETLKTGHIEDLTAQLKTPRGSADITDKIMPGGSAPFMLIFSDLPQNLENFTVEVTGFDHAAP